MRAEGVKIGLVEGRLMSGGGLRVSLSTLEHGVVLMRNGCPWVALTYGEAELMVNK